MKPSRNNIIGSEQKEQKPQLFLLSLLKINNVNKIFKSKPVGPSFANAIVRLAFYNYFAVDDIDSLIREICAEYARKIARSGFLYNAFFYALFEHDYTDTLESQQSMNLKDVHINLGQKQLTAADFVSKIKVQPDFLAEVESIQLNASEWRYLRIETWLVIFFD